MVLCIIILVMSIFDLSYCQYETNTSIKNNDEFIDASNPRVNPNRDSVEKELFPSIIHCETLGTTYEMFFYNSTFMNCAPAQWNCEYDDVILLPNKTIAHCYNRRNVGVECLYGGFKPMLKCRHGHEKCGTSFFNCKEKKPRKVVEYSDSFLIKLGKAVMSKNISVDVGLLEKIKQADDRRISQNISEIYYLEDRITVEEDKLTHIDDKKLQDNLNTDDYTINFVHSLEFRETTIPSIIPTTSITTMDYLSNKNIFNDTTKSRNISYSNLNESLHKTTTINYNVNKAAECSLIMVKINNITRNPIKSILLIILCIIINLILIFICCKIYRKVTYVYEVSEHQMLMTQNINSKIVTNRNFNSDYF